MDTTIDTSETCGVCTLTACADPRRCGIERDAMAYGFAGDVAAASDADLIAFAKAARGARTEGDAAAQ